MDAKQLISRGCQMAGWLAIFALLSACTSSDATDDETETVQQEVRSVETLEDVDLGTCGEFIERISLVGNTWYSGLLIGRGVQAANSCAIPETVGRELAALPDEELMTIAVFEMQGAVDFDQQQFPFARMANLREVSFADGPFTGTPKGLGDVNPLSLRVSGFDEIDWISGISSLARLQISVPDGTVFPQGLSAWDRFGALVTSSRFSDLTALRDVASDFNVFINGNPFPALRDLVGSRADTVIMSEDEQAEIPEVVEELRQNGIDVVSDWEL